MFRPSLCRLFVPFCKYWALQILNATQEMPSGRCVHHGLGPSLSASSISCHIGGIQKTEHAEQVGGGRDTHVGRAASCISFLGSEEERPKSTHGEVSYHFCSLSLCICVFLSVCVSFHISLSLISFKLSGKLETELCQNDSLYRNADILNVCYNLWQIWMHTIIFTSTCPTLALFGMVSKISNSTIPE